MTTSQVFNSNSPNAHPPTPSLYWSSYWLTDQLTSQWGRSKPSPRLWNPENKLVRRVDLEKPPWDLVSSQWDVLWFVCVCACVCVCCVRASKASWCQRRQLFPRCRGDRSCGITREETRGTCFQNQLMVTRFMPTFSSDAVFIITSEHSHRCLQWSTDVTELFLGVTHNIQSAHVQPQSSRKAEVCIWCVQPKSDH